MSLNFMRLVISSVIAVVFFMLRCKIYFKEEPIIIFVECKYYNLDVDDCNVELWKKLPLFLGVARSIFIIFIFTYFIDE